MGVEDTLLKIYNTSIANKINSASTLQKFQYDLQQKWIIEGQIPQAEILLFSSAFAAPAPNMSFISVLGAALHIVSRGNVHINTSDPLSLPLVNFNYLDNDYDVNVQLEMLKLILHLPDTAPLSNLIANITVPSASESSSDEALIQYIRNTLGSSEHPMGTLAMADRALGGVVDHNLKIYGTTNLRVCDASIFPIAVGSHLQATVYAIAEKLADMIKNNY